MNITGIWGSSGGYLEIIWVSFKSNLEHGGHLVVIWKLLGGHLEVIWRSFGGHFEVIWRSSGIHLEVIWMSFGVILIGPEAQIQFSDRIKSVKFNTD